MSARAGSSRSPWGFAIPAYTVQSSVRRWAGVTDRHQVSLEDPGRVAYVLGTVRAAGADNAVAALLTRDPTSHVSLSDPWDVAALLDALREAGADNAVDALLACDPASHVLDITRVRPDGKTVDVLLQALRAAGAEEAVDALAGPPTRACLTASVNSALARLPGTSSVASQTERHRDSGDGKNQTVSRGPRMGQLLADSGTP